MVIKGYALGSAPGVGNFGHAFVEIHDINSNRSRISRAGPSAPYPGGVSGALTNKKYNGITIVAGDTPSEKNIDNNQPGTEDLDSETLVDDFDEVMQSISEYNDGLNASGVGYQPRGPNSNSYAGTIFSLVTGRAASSEGETSYPGVNTDLSDAGRNGQDEK